MMQTGRRKIFIKLVAYAFMYMVFMAPYQMHLMNHSAVIFPSLDMIVLFIIMINYDIGYISLFLIGLLLDSLNGSYSGLYSMILISAAILIRYLKRKIQYMSFLLKFALFICFYLFVVICKYTVFSIIDSNSLPIFEIIVQYFVTILSYPLIYILLEKPLNLDEVSL